MTGGPPGSEGTAVGTGGGGAVGAGVAGTVGTGAGVGVGAGSGLAVGFGAGVAVGAGLGLVVGFGAGGAVDSGSGGAAGIGTTTTARSPAGSISASEFVTGSADSPLESGVPAQAVARTTHVKSANRNVRLLTALHRQLDRSPEGKVVGTVMATPLASGP